MNNHRYVFSVFMSILVPFLFYMEVFVLLPDLKKQVSLTYMVHFAYALFALLNMVGNIVFAVVTDTSIHVTPLHLKAENGELETSNGWRYCPECRCFCPPRSWHCKTCQICILKRDHHCDVIGFCIGYYNLRYFLMFLVHVFAALVYSIVYNFKRLCNINKANIYAMLKLVSMIPIQKVDKDVEIESSYIVAIIINVFFGIFTGFLMFSHVRNALRGQTSKEASLNDRRYDLGLKTNLIECLGSKWGWALVSPFVYSPLPGDGITWEHKTN